MSIMLVVKEVLAMLSVTAHLCAMDIVPAPLRSSKVPLPSTAISAGKCPEKKNGS